MPKLILALLIIISNPLAADEINFSSGVQKTQLLELYTSQGCSSCPPAENWFNRLTGHEQLWTEIIPVAFHVDYWDYLGWHDPFAKPEYSQRQRDHGLSADMAVYTPGFVMNGSEWRNFFNAFGNPPIAPLANAEQTGDLRIKLEGNALSALFDTDQLVTAEPLILNLAVLGFDLQTSILRGENGGRTINHDFVVLHHQQVASDSSLQDSPSHSPSHSQSHSEWQSELPSEFLESSQKLALAAWVSEPEKPAPLQATGGWLN